MCVSNTVKLLKSQIECDKEAVVEEVELSQSNTITNQNTVKSKSTPCRLMPPVSFILLHILLTH